MTALTAPVALVPTSIGNCNSQRQEEGHRIEIFHKEKYDNVCHKWDRKPFAEKKIRSFFGAVREERMDAHIQHKRHQIAQEGGWDQEGLVLVNTGNPFRSKLLFSVSTDDLPSQKIQYVSGTYLSKVYTGRYMDFLDWVEDAATDVYNKYGGTVGKNEFYVYYPSALEGQKAKDESIVVLFFKIAN